MKFKIAVAACVLALSGCQTYDYTRFNPDGTPKERVSLRNFMMWNNAAVISGITTDSDGTNKYSRTLEVKGLTSKGDAELLKAGVEAAKTVNGLP